MNAAGNSDPIPRLSPRFVSSSRYWRRLLVPAVLVVVAAAGVLLYRPRPGIQVTIKDGGTTPLRSVIVHAAGIEQSLGDILPGQSAATEIRPTGEGPLEVELVGKDGKVRRLKAGATLDPNRKGTLTITVKDDVITEIDRGVSFQK